MPEFAHGAHTIGDHTLAQPGCEAWAKTDDPNARARFDGEPRGGIILEITANRVITDDGEIHDLRSYRCWDYDPRTPTHQRECWLTEQQVAAFDPPNIARIRNQARRLHAEIGKQRGTRNTDEQRLCDIAARLDNIIGRTL